jgi:CubicO group peptidase (beta-lactamase class C family)
MSEEMNVEKTTGKVKQKKVMQVLGKVALWTLAALAGLVGLILVWAFISYPPAYLMRAVVWGDSDVYDYQKFPNRPLAASSTPFYFKEEPAEEMVQTLFEQNSAIDDLDDFLEQTQTQAFIVIQNDTILYEKYFEGASRDTIVTSFSCAKQWDSALIGAAIDDGYIQSVDDSITDYLPELAERDPAFSKITIYHLMRMSSGIKYQATDWLDGDNGKTYYYPDLRKLALKETTIVDAPGSGFLYNN